MLDTGPADEPTFGRAEIMSHRTRLARLGSRFPAARVSESSSSNLMYLKVRLRRAAGWGRRSFSLCRDRIGGRFNRSHVRLSPTSSERVFMPYLDDVQTLPPIQAESSPPPEPTKVRPRRRRRVLGAAAGSVLLVLIGAATISQLIS